MFGIKIGRLARIGLQVEELEARFAGLAPPRDAGELMLIVSRCEKGERQTPGHVMLTPGDGVPGDAWMRKASHKLDAQISIMRVDVARLFANGQPLEFSTEYKIIRVRTTHDQDNLTHPAHICERSCHSIAWAEMRRFPS